MILRISIRIGTMASTATMTVIRTSLVQDRSESAVQFSEEYLIFRSTSLWVE